MVVVINIIWDSDTRQFPIISFLNKTVFVFHVLNGIMKFTEILEMDLSCFQYGTIHCQFQRYQDDNVTRNSHQKQAQLECKLIQTGLGLSWHWHASLLIMLLSTVSHRTFSYPSAVYPQTLHCKVTEARQYYTSCTTNQIACSTVAVYYNTSITHQNDVMIAKITHGWWIMGKERHWLGVSNNVYSL